MLNKPVGAGGSTESLHQGNAIEKVSIIEKKALYAL